MLDYKSSHPINFDQLSVLFALDFCVFAKINGNNYFMMVNKSFDP